MRIAPFHVVGMSPASIAAPVMPAFAGKFLMFMFHRIFMSHRSSVLHIDTSNNSIYRNIRYIDPAKMQGSFGGFLLPLRARGIPPQCPAQPIQLIDLVARMSQVAFFTRDGDMRDWRPRISRPH